MFSRRTAPAHWVSGRDSMGRHARRSPMSLSASAGVSMGSAGARAQRRGRDEGLLLFLGLGVEGAQLLVEAGGQRLVGLDGGVVLLVDHRLHLLLLVVRQ